MVPPRLGAGPGVIQPQLDLGDEPASDVQLADGCYLYVVSVSHGTAHT